MADNFVANPGAGGDTFASDDITGVQYPISKLAFGALNSATLVSSTDGFPVAQQGTWTVAATQSGSWSVSQSGTWTVTGAGGTFPVTDSGGSLTVDNGGTFAVQASQAGTWTVQPGNTANTTAWLVTGTGGTFPATQSGTWTVQPGNTANTTPWLVTSGHGKTLKTVTGSASSVTDIVTAVASKRIKVVAYAFFTSSTTAVTVTLKSNGAAGTALWTVPLQSITGSVMGANLATTAPTFLCATAAGEKLSLDFSAAQTVTYNITYFDDDAS